MWCRSFWWLKFQNLGISSDLTPLSALSGRGRLRFQSTSASTAASHVAAIPQVRLVAWHDDALAENCSNDKLRSLIRPGFFQHGLDDEL